MGRVTALPALLAALAAVPTARGQVLSAPVLSAAVVRAPGPTAESLVDRDDPGGAVLGAVVLGAIGFGAVALSDVYEGALLAEALGIGLGAHIGNRGRGRAMAPLIASLGVLLAARAASQRIDLPQDGVFIVPMVQVAAAVFAEITTARGRGRGTR